jgi:hypothetical protein
MLVNVLLFIFVAGFVATVALGHVLLVAALWPGTPGGPVRAPIDTVAGARVQAFDPNAMQRALAAPLPEQKVHDMSLVYADEH